MILPRNAARNHPWTRWIARRFLSTREEQLRVAEASLAYFKKARRRSLEHGYVQQPPWHVFPPYGTSFEHNIQPLIVPNFPAGEHMYTVWTFQVPTDCLAWIYGYRITTELMDAEKYDVDDLEWFYVAPGNQIAKFRDVEFIPLNALFRLYGSTWDQADIAVFITQWHGISLVPYKRLFGPNEFINLFLYTPPGFPGIDPAEEDEDIGVGAIVYGWYWKIKQGLDPTI